MVEIEADWAHLHVAGQCLGTRRTLVPRRIRRHACKRERKESEEEVKEK